MSYIFSRALVEAYLAASCSDSAPFAPSNSNPGPQAYCSPGRMTDYSRLSRFGMTYAPLTDDRGAALLTWFLEASRARTFQPQEKAPALTAPAPASGGKCTELSMKYDRNSHSWKTHLCLWEEDLPESSVTLPASGMMLHGVCWELTPLDYPIAAPDYGFLPTPRACIGTHGIAWSRAEQGNHKCNLEDYLAYLYIRNGRKRVRGDVRVGVFRRPDDGVAPEVDELKALGNGQVPAVAATAFRVLLERFTNYNPQLTLF